MIAKRGAFEYCDSPVLTTGQQAIGNYQCPFFWQQAQDGFLNVKNYTFTINAVQDLLDAIVAIDEVLAGTIGGGLIGVGGALAGLAISSTAFLGNIADRISISGTTSRQGYCNEMVSPTALYSAAGTYSLPVVANTYYHWIPSTNEISAKNGTQALAPGVKFFSQGNSIAIIGEPGKPVTASCVKRGFRDIYAQNLCLVIIDWGAVVRQQVGSKQGIGGVLYYPEVYLLFYASGYYFCTDVTVFSGAGTIVGGITLDNSEGVVTSLNAVTSQGPPLGSPSVFGNITPNERYDAISVAISEQSGVILSENYGLILTCTGVTFDHMSTGVLPTIGTGPAQGVFMGADQLPFTVSADLKTLVCYAPKGASDYLTFRTTQGDVWTTRIPV